MTNRKKDKRLIKGRQTRQEVLSAAIDIITGEGIDQVSASKISAMIGTSKSNVFYHFKTRDAILRGVYQYIFDELKASFILKETDFKTYMMNLGQSLFDHPEDLPIYKAFFAFYNVGLFDETFRDMLKESTEGILDLIEEQLSFFVEQRGFESDGKREEIKVVAMGILCFIDGAGLHYLLNPSLPYLQETWNNQILMWEMNLFSSGDHYEKF